MADLFNSLGNTYGMPVQNPQMGQMPRPVQNRPNMFEQYKQFRQTFSGDPSAVIQEKLKSGEFTQAQVQQAQNILNNAYEMQKLFGINTDPNIR